MEKSNDKINRNSKEEIWIFIHEFWSQRKVDEKKSTFEPKNQFNQRNHLSTPSINSKFNIFC